MIGETRTPFLFLALLFVALAVTMELGGRFFLQVPPPPQTAPGNLTGLSDSERTELQARLSRASAPRDRPPGFAIAALANVDGLFLLTVVLLALPAVIGDRIHGRVQGVIGLVVGVLILIASFKAIFILLIEMTIRLTLFLAAPFGTMAYMALFASFDRGGAAVVLGLVLFLKLAGGVSLVAAQQRFLRQMGLVLMFVTAVVSSLLVSFLHGLVPIFLVSITDVIAAIVVDILAVIWALFFAIFGLIGAIKAIRLGSRQQSGPS